MLDSRASPLLKIQLAQRIDERLAEEKDKVPTLGPVFEPLPDDEDDREAVVDLREDLQDQLDRGATHAFSPSFGLGAADGAAGAGPDRARPWQGGGAVIDRADRGKLLFLGSIAVSLVLVLAYLAAGGSDYAPAKTQDPCEPREWRDPGGLQQIAEQFSLSAMDGAACKLGVSRETLARALATESSRERFLEEYDISDEELATAIRAGLLRAVDDAEEAGALSPFLAAPLRGAISLDPARRSDRTGQRRPVALRRRRLDRRPRRNRARHPRRVPARNSYLR